MSSMVSPFTSTTIPIHSVEDIGLFIRMLRMKVGIAQRDFQERAGIPKSVLSRLERGEGGGKIGIVNAALRELGYTLSVTPSEVPVARGVLEHIKKEGTRGFLAWWVFQNTSQPGYLDSHFEFFDLCKEEKDKAYASAIMEISRHPDIIGTFDCNRIERWAGKALHSILPSQEEGNNKTNG